MTLQAAIDFLEAIPERAAIRAMLTDAFDYDTLAEVGATEGFCFTANELDMAFRHWYTMRKLRQTSPGE